MERCPICGGSFRDKEWICSACGYDASADWMRHPTFVYLKTIENVNLKKKTESTMSAQEVQQRVRERIRKIQTEKREMREQVQKKIQTVQNQMRSEFSAQELEKPKKSMVVVQNGICGTAARWTLYNDGTIWIEGNGAMKDYGVFGALVTNIPWKKYRNEITSVVIDKGITVVGSCAFLECKNLSSVWMANTIQELHGWAFFGCENLENVCISSSLQIIGNDVFANCKCLKDIRLPQSLQTIDDGAFKNNKALEHIDIPFAVTSIGWNAFSGCSLKAVRVPEKVEKLEHGIFENCIHLQEVILPNELKKIESEAFLNCRALKKIRIPRNVTSIHPEAFKGCTAKIIREDLKYYDELLTILNKRR